MLQHGLFLFVSLALLTACGSTGHGGSTDTGGAGNGGAGGTGGAAVGGTGGTGGTGAGDHMDPAGPAVYGDLADEMGEPIAFAPMVCCNLQNCFTTDTDEKGHFFFALYGGPAEYVVKSFEDATTTPRRAVTMAPVEVPEPYPVDVGTLFVPSLSEGALLGPDSNDPQTLEVGDGLTLVVNRADLEPPLGGSLYDIAARKILPEHVPPLPALGGEEILAVYALYPFATTSVSPIAVSAPSDLPPGTVVRFRSMSHYDGSLSAPAPGKADGTHVKTDGLSGLEELTWIVISK